MPPLAQNFWMPNGAVYAVAEFDTTVFIGGSFTELMPALSAGIPFDATTGTTVPGFPTVTGQVFCVAPDGVGGWYLGGDFDHVGGQARRNLAHLASDLSVTAWNPGADGAVRALQPDSLGNIYVGGDFNLLGPALRPRLGQLNSAGLVMPWTPPVPNASVKAIALSGNLVFVGGSFTLMGGLPRLHLAELSAVNASLQPWNPSCDGDVDAIDVFTRIPFPGPLPVTTVLVGGSFQLPRPNLVEVRLDGSVTAWNPLLDGPVSTLLTHNRIYVAGSFTHVGAQLRNHAAAFDTTLSNLPTAWDPNADRPVETLAWSASRVFLGGGFTSVGGQSRPYLATVNDISGAVDAWSPQASGTVHSVAIGNGTLYAGGTFSLGTPLARNHLAAFSIKTGLPTSWDPNANGTVRALALYTYGPKVFTVVAGGDFSSVGSSSCSRLAAVDASSGAPAWVANVNDTVFCLTMRDTVLYAGGAFTMVNNLVEHRLVALGIRSGVVTNWACSAEGGDVLAMAAEPTPFPPPYPEHIEIAGSFTSVNGYPYSYWASVLTTTGNPSSGGATNDIVRAVAIPHYNQFSFLGGDFTQHLQSLGGSWTTGLDGTVRCLSVGGVGVWAGGDFTQYQGSSARGLVSVSEVGTAEPGDPGIVGGPVYGVASYGQQVFAGGSFDEVGGVPRINFAAFLPAPTCIGVGVGTPVLPQPREIATGDFNNDGIPDLVVCNDSSPAYLHILHGVGDGTFTWFYTILLQALPTKVVVADFDGDGHQDVAVAESGETDGIVAIYRNDGLVFTLETSAPTGGPTDGLAVGDLNSDAFSISSFAFPIRRRAPNGVITRCSWGEDPGECGTARSSPPAVGPLAEISCRARWTFTISTRTATSIGSSPETRSTSGTGRSPRRPIPSRSPREMARLSPV